jgi:hypothetical protein
MNRRIPVERVMWYEGTGFLLIITVIWLHTLPVLPSEFESAGWQEKSLLTLVVLLIAAPVMVLTRRLVARLRHLEEVFIACAWCKKIEHNEEWVSVDEFFQEKFTNVTSHGICVTCLNEMELGIRK